MGKRRRLGHPDAQHRQRPAGKQQKPPKPKPKTPAAAHSQPSQSKPTIPFDRDDSILLVGEGDLSFAASLVKHHRCRHVAATVLEKSEAEVLEKYPHAANNIKTILAGPPPRAPKNESEDDNSVDLNEEDGFFEEEDIGEEGEPSPQAAQQHTNRIIYNIDASKPFPSSCARPPPNRILFNFPHVGGKSTDVNRQVRYNQSLLVSFFTHSLRSLSREPGASIVVTLFEGEPYTLWNVRDLARHAGLQVQRSFAFRADAYPGYAHSRTLGVVRSRSGAVGGGWKGEERSSRSYVFVRKGDDGPPVGGPGKGRKRRRDEGSDDEDD